MNKIKVGDMVSTGGIDAYSVEEINKDGIAKLHWECDQYEYKHVSKLKKLDKFYVGDTEISCK